jgi:hypothetical protein
MMNIPQRALKVTMMSTKRAQKVISIRNLKVAKVMTTTLPLTMAPMTVKPVAQFPRVTMMDQAETMTLKV